MSNIFSDPWILGIGVAVLGGLILYYIFGIGRGGEASKINRSPFISAGGHITAGRDIVVGQKATDKKTKTKSPYVYKKRILIITDPEPKNLSLPINITSFKKISSKISLINAEKTKWRIGYRFLKESEPKRDYVFHVFQDWGSNSFHSRIVEIEPGVRELSPDVQRVQIGVEDTKKFELVLENKNDGIHFYVDGMPLGKYNVPLQEISDLYIRGWSHGNDNPITMVIEHVKVWF